MAFKMNKPSITQGTTAYKSALKHIAPGGKLHSHEGGARHSHRSRTSIGGMKQTVQTNYNEKDGTSTQEIVDGVIEKETEENSREKANQENNKRVRTLEKEQEGNEMSGVNSGVKKTGSALKRLKSYEKDSSQSRKDKRADEKIGGQSYNKKKAERLQSRAKKADRKYQKASAAESEGIKKYGPSFMTGEGLSKEQQKANRKISKKYAKTSKKAAVKEALAQRELGQKGKKSAKPEKVMRDGKGLKVELPGLSNVSKGSRRGGTKVAGNRERRKSKVEGGSVSVVDKKRVDVGSTIAHRKEYRQDKGLRGNLNTRRDAKGKKKI